MDVNFLGPLTMTQAAAGPYASSKAALNSLTKLATENGSGISSTYT